MPVFIGVPRLEPIALSTSTKSRANVITPGRWAAHVLKT
jgi:hypothetical protein